MPCICIYLGIVAIHLYVHKKYKFCVVYVPNVLRFFSFLSILFLPVTHVASRLLFFFFCFYKKHESLNVKV